MRMEYDVTSLFLKPPPLPFLFYLQKIITHATGLNKLLGKKKSLVVVYNVEEQ